MSEKMAQEHKLQNGNTSGNETSVDELDRDWDLLSLKGFYVKEQRLRREMLARLRPRRYFIAVLCLAVLLLVALNVANRDLWNPRAISVKESAQNIINNDSPTESPRPAGVAHKQTQATTEDYHDLAVNAIEFEEAVSEDPADYGERPWYMAGGTRRPRPQTSNRKKRKPARLYPFEDSSDRITNQLMHVPAGYDPEGDNLKTILLYNGAAAWNVRLGREQFVQARCPVDRCRLAVNRERAQRADAILYKDHFTHPGFTRPINQVWIMYFLECPYHTQHINFPDVFNWTATYRYDSDIVAPYEHWEYYNPKVKQVQRLERNYAANKTKAVAWFVSNCGARNGRLQYAHELQKYIQVDIYGACGTMKCSRANAEHCFELLDRDYKFYLAFENSNCKDYITEKFFVNGLGRDILPIVMGARPEDYERAAPKHSYIHVDDFAGPRQLAEYLHKLDKDDALYNEYFRWKGTGELINTYFWCRMCTMLHAEPRYKSYRDINEWWRGRGICTLGSWRKRKTDAQPAADAEEA